MNLYEITPVSMIKNEDYWIYYVLRDVLEVFGRMIVLDTGSTDNTLSILRFMQSKYPGLTIIEENFGDDADAIGNGRNVLMSNVQTEWMFLIDGDEIWRKKHLLALMDAIIPDDKRVAMIQGWNVEDVDGKLLLRSNDIGHYDRLFRKGIKWHVTEYPFESYGLGNTFPQEDVYYVESDIMNNHGVYFYHMRHTTRSTMNEDAYFRKEKKGFYPWDGGHVLLIPGWLNVEDHILNPYVVSRDSAAEILKDMS